MAIYILPSGILFEYKYEDRFLEKIRLPNLVKWVLVVSNTYHSLCMNQWTMWPYVNVSMWLKNISQSLSLHIGKSSALVIEFLFINFSRDPVKWSKDISIRQYFHVFEIQFSATLLYFKSNAIIRILRTFSEIWVQI